MTVKGLVAQLKFWKECKRYGLVFWQCPGTLVLIMGAFTIASILATYYITREEQNPEILVGSMVIITLFVLTISFFIIRIFEELAKSNMLKTDFVSIASHQLRTPLTSARWTLNLLLDKHADGVSDKQRDFLLTIQDSNERMMKLVNDLLSVSRIEQGRLKIQRDKVEVTSIVRELAMQMKAYAEANNITFSVHVPEKKIYVEGDPHYIKLILENLIDNAIRYSGKAGTIEIRADARDHRVRFAVADQGVGIPRVEQGHVFEKFFRSENVMRRQTEGSGLGLFVARAAVLGMKGSMGFSSKENDGSTFWFELPNIT